MGLLFNRVNSGFLYPVNKTVDSLISVTNGMACLFSSIFGAAINPAEILKGLALVGAGLINSIISSVTAVIYKRVKGMLGALLAPVREIEKAIEDLTNILISTQNILDKALNMDNYFKNRQNCSNQAANLLNCIAQSAINQITNKVAMNVDKEIGKLTDGVAKKAMSSGGAIHGFLDRNTKFVAKAKLQTKLLT
jgi:hypothetical protein